ncbi:MAG: exonuclease domain-containing protein [Alphaproteobacteria bacterium]|nr:hypothetical protein [Alphaproteobacteria bacterium]MCS5596610.1 exonuclease domain-containing protein [Alphaproteobacteria bacterium]
MSNIIIIYDTEMTCWAKSDGTSSWWSEDWQEPEIIQIAAIMVETKNFTEVAPAFNIFIKPTLNPSLSPYCTKLTSITDDILNKEGVTFKRACTLFNAYCQNHPQYSYGGDHTALNYNITQLYNLSNEITPFTGHDISKLFHSIDPATKSVNSGGLAKHFGLCVNINQHYALEDCRSMQASLQHFKDDPKLLSYFKAHNP